MSYNDKILERYDASMDDEFEREMLYRSVAISYTWSIWTLYISSAIMAWLLPGPYALFAVLPQVGMIASMGVGDSWLRKRVPYPRLNGYSTTEKVLMVAISLLTVTGVLWNLSTVMDSDFSFGGIIGAVVGIIASLVILKHLTTYQRGKDRERLDAQLDEE